LAASAVEKSVSTVKEVPTTTGLIRAKTTERLIAALVPPAQQPGTSAITDGGLVVLPALAPEPTQHSHRVALIDDHGRLREASLFAALGWAAYTAVTIQESDDALVVRADPSGSHRLDPKGRLRVPDALRKFRGWSAGSAVLLSVPNDEPVLVLTPTSVLDSLVVPRAC
jgi:hypothetical protein